MPGIAGRLVLQACSLRRRARNAGFAQTVHMLFLIKPDPDPFDADDRNWPWFQSPCRGAHTYDNTVELQRGNQEAINQLC